MEINQKKLNRQLGRIEKWKQLGAQGTGEACTGYGKTYEAILVIQRIHRKYPNAKIDVVVPGIDLKHDWEKKGGHIQIHKLNHVSVYVINTYVQSLHSPFLLILDEVHHYASNEFGKVFEVSGCVPLIERKGGEPFILALTATLERLDGKHSFIQKYCPVFDTVTLEEARREGYISDYVVYNWGLEFNEEDQKEYEKQDSILKNAFGKFNHNFELALSCSFGAAVVKDINVPVQKKASDGSIYTTRETLRKTVADWRLWWAQQQEWDGEKESFWSPGNIAKYAQQFSTSMRARKTICHLASVKKDAVRQLFEKFPVKTMVFAENSKFADEVEEMFGTNICRAYHVKIKPEIMNVESMDKKGRLSYKLKSLGVKKTKERIKELFTKGDLMILSTVRALNEGFDFAGIRLGIMASYNSSKRDDTQRTGRNTRTDVDDLDKKAIVVNLYIIGSQEEKCLKEKQRDKQGMVWVTSIDQITLEDQLSINLADV